MSIGEAHELFSGPDKQTDQRVVDWRALADGISRGDTASMEQLYSILSRRLRGFFHRQLGDHDINDKLHDVFITVTAVIRRGELRTPECLMGFVQTIASRRVAQEIRYLSSVRKREVALDDNLPVKDRSETPDDILTRKNFMKTVLQELSPRQCEILTRFYIEEQSQQKICAEMNLDYTQFRLLKSRSKAKLGDIGRRRLAGLQRTPEKRSIANRAYTNVHGTTRKVSIC